MSTFWANCMPLPTLIQTIPRCILGSIFLVFAQARFTSAITPSLYEYETSKSERTQKDSWLGVSPWLHQRIIAVPVGLVGLGLLWGLEDSGRIRQSGALGAMILLAMGITARVRAGMGAALPASVLALAGYVTCVEFGLVQPQPSDSVCAAVDAYCGL